MHSEIEFIMAQRTHLQSFQNGAIDLSVHITYEFVLNDGECSYQVNHTSDECQTIYRSSGERVDMVGRCNLTNEQIKGVWVREFLELCPVLSEKWTFIYRKLVDMHRIDNVYALFWEESGRDGNYTTCILRSPAPFVNDIALSGPGLRDVFGSTDEGANDTVTEAYNKTHPNIRCHIESPTGWSTVIMRVGERNKKISLAEGLVDPEDDVDAADIRAALLIIVGIFLVIFSVVCWIKRRDIIDSIVEMYDWWWGKKRRRYSRVSHAW